MPSGVVHPHGVRGAHPAEKLCVRGRACLARSLRRTLLERNSFAFFLALFPAAFRARTPARQSRKIFSCALGNTTVPMSRPSITMPPPAPARCWLGDEHLAYLAIVASRDAACATSPVRISRVTSARQGKTQFFAPKLPARGQGGFSSMCVSFAALQGGTHCRAQLSAAAPSICQGAVHRSAVQIQIAHHRGTRRATLLLPTPRDRRWRW